MLNEKFIAIIVFIRKERRSTDTYTSISNHIKYFINLRKAETGLDFEVYISLITISKCTGLINIWHK